MNHLLQGLKFAMERTFLLGLGVAMGASDPENIWIWAALFAIAVVIMALSYIKRERIVQDLRYSKASLDLFFDNASVGISHVDANGRFQTVNPRFAAFLGYTKDELEKKMSLSEVTPPEERAMRENLFRTFLESGHDTLSADRLYLRKDGSEIWLRLVMQRLNPGDHGADGTIAAAMDVTVERRHLRRHENFRQALLMIANGDDAKEIPQHIGQSLREDLAIVDGCEIYQQVGGPNMIYYQFGITKRDAKGRWSETLVSRSKDVLGQMVVYARETAEFQEDELTVIREYASPLSVALESRTRDMQIAKHQYQIISSEKMASLGILAAGLAHEISNPTAVIESRAGQIVELLQDPVANAGRVSDLCRIIARNSSRILKIVQSVRTLSRHAEADNFQPAHLRSIIEDTMTLCADSVAENGIAVDIADFPEDLSIECREAQIAQILLNLMTNACAAIKDLDERWIRIDVKEEVGEKVVISVTDSGGGIPPELAKRLFQPFFTTKEVGKGTGLGLSISADIARDHGGVLRIDPNCEHTRFCLELPSKQTGTAAAQKTG